MNYKVSRASASTTGRKKMARAQASRVIGGWRGFGLNQVHNIESSCCVMQSDDEDRVGRGPRDYELDGAAGPDEKDGDAAVIARSSALSPSNRKSRKSGARLAINSSRISEASSKYRVSEEGRQHEQRSDARQSLIIGDDPRA